MKKNIIQSATEPDKNSLWLSPQGLKKFSKKGWKLIGGNTGGGNTPSDPSSGDSNDYVLPFTTEGNIDSKYFDEIKEAINSGKTIKHKNENNKYRTITYSIIKENTISLFIGDFDENTQIIYIKPFITDYYVEEYNINEISGTVSHSIKIYDITGEAADVQQTGSVDSYSSIIGYSLNIFNSFGGDCILDDGIYTILHENNQIIGQCIIYTNNENKIITLIRYEVPNSNSVPGFVYGREYYINSSDESMELTDFNIYYSNHISLLDNIKNANKEISSTYINNKITKFIFNIDNKNECVYKYNTLDQLYNELYFIDKITNGCSEYCIIGIDQDSKILDRGVSPQDWANHIIFNESNDNIYHVDTTFISNYKSKTDFTSYKVLNILDYTRNNLSQNIVKIKCLCLKSNKNGVVQVNLTIGDKTTHSLMSTIYTEEEVSNNNINIIKLNTKNIENVLTDSSNNAIEMIFHEMAIRTNIFSIQGSEDYALPELFRGIAYKEGTYKIVVEDDNTGILTDVAYITIPEYTNVDNTTSLDIIVNPIVNNKYFIVTGYQNMILDSDESIYQTDYDIYVIEDECQYTPVKLINHPKAFLPFTYKMSFINTQWRLIDHENATKGYNDIRSTWYECTNKYMPNKYFRTMDELLPTVPIYEDEYIDIISSGTIDNIYVRLYEAACDQTLLSRNVGIYNLVDKMYRLGHIKNPKTEIIIYNPNSVSQYFRLFDSNAVSILGNGVIKKITENNVTYTCLEVKPSCVCKVTVLYYIAAGSEGRDVEIITEDLSADNILIIDYSDITEQLPSKYPDITNKPLYITGLWDYTPDNGSLTKRFIPATYTYNGSGSFTINYKIDVSGQYEKKQIVGLIYADGGGTVNHTYHTVCPPYTINLNVQDGTNTGTFDDNTNIYKEVRQTIYGGGQIVIKGTATTNYVEAEAVATDYIVLRWSVPRIGDDGTSVTLSVYELKLTSTDYTTRVVHKTI